MSVRQRPQGPNPDDSAAAPQAPHAINLSHGARAPRSARGRAGAYYERLLVPVSYWLLAVPTVVTLGAEAYFFVDGFIPPLVIAALFAIVAAFLVNWSSATIEVTGAVLRAGKDTLALDEAGDVVALDEKQAMALRGPRADPSAHILLRPYLKRAVYIALADPAEGVPYWLVATRHPEKLAAAIESARAPGRQPEGHQSGGWSPVG